jgi:hypothetical protein
MTAVAAVFVGSILLVSPGRAEKPAPNIATDEQNVDETIFGADLFPKSTVAYGQLQSIAKWLEIARNHRLRPRIESMPVVKALRESNGKELKKLREGIAAFEGSMGQAWPDAVAKLSDGGLYVGIDGSTQGVAALLHCSDHDLLKRFQAFLLAVGQLESGGLRPQSQAEYRGLTVYALGKDAKLTLMDSWMLLTNNSSLGKSIVDRYMDQENDSLAQTEIFQTARKLAKFPTTFGFLDVAKIREADVAEKLYSGRTDNPLAEALVGGVASNLQHTPLAVVSSDLTSEAATFQLAAAHKRDWEAGREYFFGEPAPAAAPPLVSVPDRLFALSAHRDLSQMWLRAPDLMTDKANEGIAKADTQLTTFFSGRDFGQDILGSLGSQLQFVAVRQDFHDRPTQPAIKLPAFAMKFRMLRLEETSSEFRRVFQSFIGFLNVVSAMQGQPQFDLGLENEGDATFVTATYIPPVGQENDQAAPIQFNFSPTLAFSGNQLVLSSTTPLARQLLRPKSAVETAVSSAAKSNTRAVLHADALQRILNDNRGQLVAQNMLEKGHGPEDAENEIRMLLGLLDLFEKAEMSLIAEDDRIELTASIQVALEDSSDD